MESDELLQESDKWLADLEHKFPKRNFMTTVVNLEGLSIFVTRYIKALQPPSDIPAGNVSTWHMWNTCLPFMLIITVVIVIVVDICSISCWYLLFVVVAGNQEMIARFVSFIPSVSDSIVFPGLCDIWSNCSVSIISFWHFAFWLFLFGVFICMFYVQLSLSVNKRWYVVYEYIGLLMIASWCGECMA